MKTNVGRGAKLEFYAHIYFLVYAMKNGTGEEAEKSKLEEAKLNFRQFIESADKLSQTTEFLHFYALPYVPNPQVHPQLKECFTDEWAISKQEEFESYRVVYFLNVGFRVKIGDFRSFLGRKT